MQQRSFGRVEYEHKKVKTRRQTFLERMDRLVPWAELEQRIAPVYPKPGRGRRPYPLRVMLRIHCLQLWFNLSDPGMEQELYDSRSMLEFAGLSLSEPIPDETTIRAVIDEEPGASARPRDASDQKGPAVVLRDEAAQRHGRADGAGPQPEHDGGERVRRDRGASPVARR